MESMIRLQLLQFGNKVSELGIIWFASRAHKAFSADQVLL
jgi:hypothetical protein